MSSTAGWPSSRRRGSNCKYFVNERGQVLALDAYFRKLLSQLTDTVGSSVTDTVGDSYTSTVGTADSVSDSASRDQSASVAVSDSRAITEGINASTSWGWSTSRAIGANSSLVLADANPAVMTLPGATLARGQAPGGRAAAPG